MSGKLDQSLDEINAATRRTGGGRRRNPRRSATKPAVAAAPAGGVTKSKKVAARTTGAKTVAPKAPAANSESKIIVSNLPRDVTQQQVKEYFTQSVGGLKKVELVYGPNSQSRGIANISFSKADGAGKAFQKLNGLLVDNRPIKIEIVVGAAQADKVMPVSKTLAERTTQPKAQPKSAAATKKGANVKGAKADATKAAPKAKKGRNARPAKKTAEELDSDMADYFVANATNNENAAAPAAAAAAGGEAMDEGIM